MTIAASKMAGGGCGALEPYALQVLGDSMAPEFWDGCIVIVEPGAAARPGSFVVADCGGDVVLRQLRVEDGRRFLDALGPGYAAIELTGGCTIRGVVVQRAGRRRSQRKHYD
jgi:SOS-response transcriptional repressor LexA